MLTGVLVAESLRVGGELTGIPLTVKRIWRADIPNATRPQPQQWTLIEFEVPDEEAGRLAKALAACLDDGPWYADVRGATETIVAYAGRVFRYPRSDEAGRARAVAYGRSVGVPAAQLDWAP